jgi:hypothetical protein
MRKKFKRTDRKIKYGIGAIVAVALLISSAMVLSFATEDVEARRISKTQSTMTLTLASSTVELNKVMHANGLLMGGTGIAGVTVNLKVTLPDGSVAFPSQGASTTTNSAGGFAMDYVPTKAGTYKFTATFAGNTRYAASSTVQSFAATTPTVNNVLPVRWTWQQSPVADIVGQSYVYSIKFEVQYATGGMYGAGTTRIDFKFTSPSGTTTTLSSTTPDDTTGIASVNFSPTVAGTWTVKCDWDHNNQVYAWDSSPAKSISVTTTTPVPPTPTKQNTVVALSGATSVQTGSAEAISGTLKTASGTAISGATVTISVTYPGGSKSSPVSVTTNANGGFTYSITPTAAGSHVVTVTYVGNTNNNGSVGTMNFSATAPAPPPAASYDYIVSSAQVKTPTGAIAYTGSSFTSALQWAVSQTGKTVYVPAGTYKVDSAITPKGGVTLVGDGDGTTGTVFDFTSTNADQSRILIYNVNGVTLKKFRIIDNGIIQAQATGGVYGGHVLQDITIYRTSPIHLAAFYLFVTGSGSALDGFQFIRCQALEVGTNGFWIRGDSWNAPGGVLANYNIWAKNIYLEDCRADYCGYYARVGDWCVGYDLSEGVNVDGIKMVRCEASYNWEAGFYFEHDPTIKNVYLQECTSNNNGRKPSTYANDDGSVGPQYGYGYLGLTTKDVHYTSCTGTGNALGLTNMGKLPA